MEALAIGLIALVFGLIGVGAGGFVLYRMLKKNIIEPKVVYEEPTKKKAYLVPGDGIIEVHTKRKCKAMDEEALAIEEMKRLNS